MLKEVAEYCNIFNVMHLQNLLIFEINWLLLDIRDHSLAKLFTRIFYIRLDLRETQGFQDLQVNQDIPELMVNEARNLWFYVYINVP